MNRLIGWITRLYPAAWRARYGGEFAALLEDSKPGWRDAGDLLKGAFSMHFSRPWNFTRMAAILAAAGAVVAAIVAFSMPDQFEARAVLTVERPGMQWTDMLIEVAPMLFSRTALSGIITDPRFDLYHEQRKSRPLEALAQEMRLHIRVRLLDAPAGSVTNTFAVAFTYSDRFKAQAVVNELTARLIHSNPERFRITQASELPASPRSPNRLNIILAGIVAGALLGLLAGLIMRWPGVAGRAAGLGAAGLAAALVIALLIPSVYESRAVLKLTVQQGTPEQALERIVGTALSDAHLQSLIRDPVYDLYHNLRAKQPVSAAVEAMRSDLRVTRLDRGTDNRGRLAVSVAFRYPDRFKAKAVVGALTTDLVEQTRPARRDSTDTASAGLQAELLEPADLPEFPVKPNRAAIAGYGLALGILAGLLSSLLRRPAAPALATA